MRKVITELTLKTLATTENKKFIVKTVVSFIRQIEGLYTDYQEIKMVLREVVDNVIIHAYPDKQGDIYVCMYLYDDKALEIKVSDFGCGIEDIEKAKSPCYTTKKDHGGMGFVIMEAFSKKMTVESTPGKGTVVKMSFKTK